MSGRMRYDAEREGRELMRVFFSDDKDDVLM
jgi:hypothetical protein